jgi:hypothetical protein
MDQKVKMYNRTSHLLYVNSGKPIIISNNIGGIEIIFRNGQKTYNILMSVLDAECLRDKITEFLEKSKQEQTK